MQRTAAEKVASGVWLSSEDTAEYLGVTAGALHKWRNESRGPRFSRFSGKVIRYFSADVEQWARDPINGPSASNDLPATAGEVIEGEQ